MTIVVLIAALAVLVLSIIGNVLLFARLEMVRERHVADLKEMGAKAAEERQELENRLMAMARVSYYPQAEYIEPPVSVETLVPSERVQDEEYLDGARDRYRGDEEPEPADTYSPMDVDYSQIQAALSVAPTMFADGE